MTLTCMLSLCYFWKRTYIIFVLLAFWNHHTISLFCHPLLIFFNKRPLIKSSFSLHWPSLSPLTFPLPPSCTPTATTLLPSLCSLFACAQMAGAAEQGQGGERKKRRVRQREKLRPKKISQTMPDAQRAQRGSTRDDDEAERKTKRSCEKSEKPHPLVAWGF